MATPVFWHNGRRGADAHYPYAVIGDADWADYTVSADVLLPRAGSSAGLIGRFSCRGGVPNVGQFDGYVFSVSGTGPWSLTRNANPEPGRVPASAAGTSGGPRADGSWPPGELARPLGTGALAPAVAVHVGRHASPRRSAAGVAWRR